MSLCSVSEFLCRVSLCLSVCVTSFGTEFCSRLGFDSGPFSRGLNFDGRYVDNSEEELHVPFLFLSFSCDMILILGCYNSIVGTAKDSN